MTAREFLAAVQQRADDPRAKYHHKPCSAPVCGSRHCQTARDRDVLAAARTAALDLADRADRFDGYADPEGVVTTDALRAAITAALTPKENDRG